MPKRRRNSSEEERLRKKIRRYEEKLAKLPNKEHELRYEENATYYKVADANYEYDILAELGVPPTPSLHDDSLQSISPVQPVFDLAQWDNVQQTVVPTPCDAEPPPAASCSGTALVPDAPCSSATPTPAPVDPDLLSALGDCHADTPEWGDNISDDVAQRWGPILKSGLSKEVRESTVKKYLYPKNMPMTKPPLLNPEISAVLTETSKNRDIRVCNKQGQLGQALTAIGKVITGLLTKNMETSETIRILNDAGKLIADSHYMETETRRSLIMPLLDKSFTTPIKDRKRDTYLFGDNLSEFIKSSQGIKKTGQLITPPVAPTPGNSRSGPQRNLRYQRGMPAGRHNAPLAQQPYQQHRPQQYQRRPPPPPAARRNPPAPGQPQRAPYRPRNAAAN